MKKKYFIILSCFMPIIIGCNPGIYYEYVNDIFAYQDCIGSRGMLVSEKPGLVVDIFGDVISYKFDKNFVLALQKPDYELHKMYLSGNLRFENKVKYPNNNDYTDRLNSEKEADSLLKNDPYYIKIFSHKLNYWIATCGDDKVYGPLTKTEYIQKRKELGVPDDLQLKEQQ